MLDAYIPAGAFSPTTERELVATVTDLFLEHEGVDPANEQGRKLAWVFIHRPAVYVGGEPPRSPRYRFICQVPEGQYNDARRNAITAGITQAVATAEAGAWPHPELRVCVFTLEVPDGAWGGAGTIIRLPDNLRVHLATRARDGRRTARHRRKDPGGTPPATGAARSGRSRRARLSMRRELVCIGELIARRVADTVSSVGQTLFERSVGK